MKFIKHISTLRYFILVACFILFTCYTTEIKCDLTTKEKIQLHKEWLIRRQKSTHNRILRQPPKNDTEARINHFRKLINFKSSQLPITENDISFTSDITEIIQSHTVPSTEPVTTQTKVALNYYGPSTSNLTASTSPSSPWPGDKNQASSEGSISSTTESFFPPTLKVKSVFSNWSNWTSCSRSCGGGVKSQTRKCVKRTNLDGKKSTFDSTTTESNECIGVFKRFHICNDHKCPDEESLIDYRELQCKKFDNQLFGGKRYLWEAYIKDDAECELNCKPIGMKYFATLAKTVIDGTKCFYPSEYTRRRDSSNAICVEGSCLVK